ncbi:MAG: class D beta-lactamase [Lachnospiraceae bacterium]|nr:class D beta-lactamase [Lachnospiraceae bacterium]
MRKVDISFKSCCVFILLVFALMGCTKESDSLTENQPVEMQVLEDNSQTEESSIEKKAQIEEETDESQEKVVEPMIMEVDWSDYFEKINGAAVIYNPTENCYQVYNQELALTRRSPCSTFKIISSLIALENGIIEPNNSVRRWSGEVFWNEDWNKDIDFSDAFHTSCVWYFREVINEIGKDMMQDELNKLQYGNCDISDWGGQLNTNNNNPVLTGFWIESSLLISPKEQAEVIESIFGDNTNYSEETRKQLKQVMLLPESNDSNILIYGKTGMGKSYGIVVDSWFTGLADTPKKRIYFCVYLGETNNKNVSSAKAREIAIKIVSAYLN